MALWRGLFIYQAKHIVIGVAEHFHAYGLATFIPVCIQKEIGMRFKNHALKMPLPESQCAGYQVFLDIQNY